jgi:hypothetical protein
MKSNMLLKKKRNFLLIELLISIFFITIMLIPLFKNPFYFFKKEIKEIERLECERIAEKSYLEIYLKLADKNSNREILQNLDEKKTYNLKDEYIKIGDYINKRVIRSYKISPNDGKITENKTIYKVLTISILLKIKDNKDPYKYNYKLLTSIKS